MHIPKQTLNRGQSGFTLLEVMIAMSVMAVASLGVIAGVLVVSQTDDITRAEQRAHEAARSMIAVLTEWAKTDSIDLDGDMVNDNGFDELIRMFRNNRGDARLQVTADSDGDNLIDLMPFGMWEGDGGVRYHNRWITTFDPQPWDMVGRAWLHINENAVPTDFDASALYTDPNDNREYGNLTLDQDGSSNIDYLYSGGVDITDVMLIPIEVEVRFRINNHEFTVREYALIGRHD